MQTTPFLTHTHTHTHTNTHTTSHCALKPPRPTPAHTHSDSHRRTHLLDGYDLRHELRELLQEGQTEDSGIRAGDGDYSALALAGAEAVLFGARDLSAEEERAVRAGVAC